MQLDKSTSVQYLESDEENQSWKLKCVGNIRTYFDGKTLSGTCLLSDAHEHGGY